VDSVILLTLPASVTELDTVLEDAMFGSLGRVAPAARLILLGLCLSAVAALSAQTLAPVAWTDREAAVEESLRTSKIARIEMLPIGVTHPRRAFFSPGSLFGSAAWKPLRPGMRRGYWESYKSEIAAYELDKLLGMHMVPPAVEREIEGEKGALILWLDGTKSWNLKDQV